MELIKEGNVYVALCEFTEKSIPKAAGFRWSPTNRVWHTTDITKASLLSQYAEPTLAQSLTDEAAETERKLKSQVQASQAVTASANFAPVTPEGLTLMPFQMAGVEAMAGRQDNLLADEMGLGKTIQALSVANQHHAKSILIVCPASLRLNWEKEAQKWLVDDSLSIGVAKGKACPDVDVLIINYDILKSHIVTLQERTWDLLVLDEAHMCKNPKARRTKLALSLEASRKLFVTGTPVTNRPKELFPLVNRLRPDLFPDFFAFARRYCDAHRTRWGWDFDGASNLDELQEILRTSLMVRRLKADVLTELPPKRRQVIELAANGAARVIKAEQSAFEAQQAVLADLRSAVELARVSDDPEEYGHALRALREGIKVAFTEISEVRRTTARAKVKHVVEHIKTTIDSGVSKIVLFAHHLDVIAEIETALTDCDISSVTLTGKQSMVQRNEAVEAFQTTDTQVFIGGIKAAGVGLTLTSASLVIFAELDWVPSTITQCEDRCHRIGQTGSVLVQHLVLEGSIDANMANTLVSKQAVLDDLLDTQHTGREAPIIPHDDAVTISDTELKRAQELVPTPMMDGILHALRHLASLCDGAQGLDGQGFNKWDSRTGKILAGLEYLTPRQAALGRKIVHRYRRQLDSEMLAAAGVSTNNQ